MKTIIFSTLVMLFISSMYYSAAGAEKTFPLIPAPVSASYGKGAFTFTDKTRATVMSWRGEQGGIEAAKSGHDVIMTPGKYTYFCYYHTENHAGEPQSLGGYVPLELAYNYNPTPKELSAEEQKHILGLQGCLWN